MPGISSTDPSRIPLELRQDLGDRLRKSLQFAGMSVADMAGFLEVHRNSVSGWLANRSRPMKLIVRMWAERTGVPTQWLIDGSWPDEEPRVGRQEAKAQPAAKRSSTAPRTTKKASTATRRSGRKPSA